MMTTTVIITREHNGNEKYLSALFSRALLAQSKTAESKTVGKQGRKRVN